MNLVRNHRMLSLLFLLSSVAYSAPTELTYQTKATEFQASIGQASTKKNYSENSVKRKGQQQKSNYSLAYGYSDDLSFAYSSSLLWINKEFNERSDIAREERITKGHTNGDFQITYRLMANNPFVIDLIAGLSIPYGLIKMASGNEHGSAYSPTSGIAGLKIGGTIYELEWLASAAVLYHLSSEQLDQEQDESYKVDNSVDLNVDLAMQYNYTSQFSIYGDVSLDIVTEKNGISLRANGNREKIDSLSRTVAILGIKYLFLEQLFITAGFRYSKDSDYTINRGPLVKLRENNEELGVFTALTFNLL